MQGDIVDVRAQAVTDVEVEARGFGGLTKVLLFITDVVFATSNDPRALDALDSLGK